MDRTNKRAVVFSISTYQDLRERAGKTLEILDELITLFTVDEYQPQSLTVYYANAKISILKFSNRNLINVKKKIMEKEVAELNIRFDSITLGDIYATGVTQPLEIQVSIGLCGHQMAQQKKHYATNVPNGISFMVSEIALKRFSMEGLKTRFLKIFTEIKGLYGYIETMNQTELGVTIFPTPMEWTNLKHMKAEMGFDGRARGYFWGNILTAGHIEKLGGVEYIETYAPCKRIEKIDGQNDMLFLQLSDSINDANQAQYLKLKTFLRPILSDEDIIEIAKRTYFDQDLFNNFRLVFSDEEKMDIDRIFSIPREKFNEFLYPKRTESLNKTSEN